MKHFGIIFVSTVVLFTSTEAKIPDYIHICKRNDPEVSKCIQETILSLKDQLVAGIPEFDVPKLDPLSLEKLILTMAPGVTAQGTNLQMTGVKDFEIHDLIADLKTNTYSFDVSIPEVNVRGHYEIDTILASIPLKGKGPISLIAKSVSGRGALHGKRVFRDGRTRYYFPSMDLKLRVTDYEIRLGNLFEGDVVSGETTNKLLNEEKTSVLAGILPAIEKTVVGQILTTANNICKHFTWDELFPES